MSRSTVKTSRLSEQRIYRTLGAQQKLEIVLPQEIEWPIADGWLFLPQS
jgi:hypothetical protein